MTIAEEVAKILLDIKGVTLRPNEPYQYTSGIVSPIYTDCRLLISYPKKRTRVIELLSTLIEGKPDVIAGTSTAGIPHAAYLSQLLGLPMVYVRSKSKGHGKQRQIEGAFEAGQTAVVVEDLISTGGSSMETVSILREAGGIVNQVVAIFDYGLPQSVKRVAEAGVSLSGLTTFKDVVEVAILEKHLQEKDRELVLDWAADSTGWAKKNGFGANDTN